MRSLVCLVFAACGSSAGGAHRADHPTTEGHTAAIAAGPSERECDDLIAHAIGLGIDEQASRPAEQRANDADREAVRASVRADFARGCRDLPRERYQCAIAAATLEELAACQPTPSSSTSNSSVAPGGITAPAPRSP